MLKYLRKRLVMMIFLLLGMTFIVFASLYFAPGDPAEIAAGPSATMEEIELMRQYLGLDRPFIVQYGTYLWNLLHGDFGTSLITRQPILSELLIRLPNTLNLATSAMILACLIGIPLGIVAAIYKDTWIDNTLTTLSLAGISIPNFWLGTVLIIYFCVQLGWFPTGGMSEFFWTKTGFRQAFLPALSLGMQTAAGFTRIGRSSMLDVLQSDYIRTARSKGLRGSKIVWVHALRNALIPIVTQMGTSFGSLLGGSIVTEQVFAVNGIGTYLINAINQRNYNAVQSTVLVIAFMFLLVNLIVDLLYLVIDPRIKYE
ncbi:MAG: ABC transporter permease [Erysipelotrichaceae bacterium]|nr:ABC transporter permease [Erysipelotrichaceae bacterium]MBQ1511964.1 ABC transporter permease [Erysipelotrichaceae bacterium]MBR3150749.1 ABC transporter permease [Erysipelotrichaceae bacterium]